MLSTLVRYCDNNETELIDSKGWGTDDFGIGKVGETTYGNKSELYEFIIGERDSSLTKCW